MRDTSERLKDFADTMAAMRDDLGRYLSKHPDVDGSVFAALESIAVASQTIRAVAESTPAVKQRTTAGLMAGDGGNSKGSEVVKKLQKNFDSFLFEAI